MRARPTLQKSFRAFLPDIFCKWCRADWSLNRRLFRRRWSDFKMSYFGSMPKGSSSELNCLHVGCSNLHFFVEEQSGLLAGYPLVEFGGLACALL